MNDYIQMFFCYHNRGDIKASNKYSQEIYRHDGTIALFSEYFDSGDDAVFFAKCFSSNYDCTARAYALSDKFIVVVKDVAYRRISANYRSKDEYFIFANWLFQRPMMGGNKR